MFISLFSHSIFIFEGFPGGSDDKESTCSVGTWVRSLGWEDPLEEGMATLLQYSCLQNPHGQTAWWVTVHEVTKSRE